MLAFFKSGFNTCRCRKENYVKKWLKKT